MPTDLQTMPYSRRGSWFVISELKANWNRTGNEAGLYLRTVHSSASTPLVAEIRILKDGETVPYEAEIRNAALFLDSQYGRIECCFDDADTLLIRGCPGLELTLDFMTRGGGYDYVYAFSRDGRAYQMANCYKNNIRVLVSMQYGDSALDQEWRESTSMHSRLTFSGKDGFLAVLREIETEWDGRWKEYDFDASRAASDSDLASFLSRMPSCPEAFRETAEKAAYLLWATTVRRDGFLPRDAILMSKNWMKSVWSWDHCFNAIALSYGDPESAWDQFMIMFDCQDPTGLLPDSINDVHVVWNYCKPPIHGWALRRMMRNMELTQAQTEEAYGRLSRWTDWWMKNRDYDGDGLYEYNHGNDSGWDNSTAFSALPPTATPELQGFLVIQTEVLSDLALKLGRKEEAEAWKDRSVRLLDRLLAAMYEDGLPTVLRSGSHETVPNQSLLPYISLLLGERLPKTVRSRMIGVLKSGRFRSEHGFATEALKSPLYRSDGYWRGPIWAPSTLLLLDGLSACGETDLVSETARRFADMVGHSGFAENFDAVTGEGLRDRSYTWTASVFLILAHDYL